MAIVMQPKFPVPDRSKQPMRAAKDHDGILDVGWCEGVLSDGRTFRGEMWAQDQVSVLTLFFSAIDLEQMQAEDMRHLVEREGLVLFRKTGASYCAAAILIDDSGNRLWSVNIVVGDEERLYLDKSVSVFPYSTCGGVNSMFRR